MGPRALAEVSLLLELPLTCAFHGFSQIRKVNVGSQVGGARVFKDVNDLVLPEGLVSDL